MKSIGYSKFGAADQVLELRNIPTPDPGPGEVLVELTTSSVNPSDVKARAGARPGVTEPPFAFIIPHSDGAGRIVAVGDGVAASRINQRVWIWNGQWQRAFGTATSHICLPESQAVAMPDHVSDATGAQLGIPGLTAAHAVFCAGAVKGKRVLINGAAGTVGHLATQLAVWGGADVVATARGDGLHRARDAGAHSAIDYSSDNLSDQILSAAGGPIDHIVEVEFGVNAQTCADVIAENGSMGAYGSAKVMNPEMPFYAFMFKAVTLHMILIYLLPAPQRKAAISILHDALGSGGLNVPVAHSFDLADCAKAHAQVEQGGRTGGILVTCN